MSNNLRIWSQVEKTNPAHTKQVNQRGGFTAVSANYQIMRATEVFGPIGEGWGYDAGAPIFQDTLMIVPVTMWHSGDRTRVFGPMYGCEEWKDKNGRVDSDAPKKATTDAITKLLSQLGFNADVFLGRYDDSKYVAAVRREFEQAERAASAVPEPDPASKITDATRDWISDQLTRRNLIVGDLCAFMGVPSLKDLTYAQLDAVKAWLRDPKKDAA